MRASTICFATAGSRRRTSATWSTAPCSPGARPTSTRTAIFIGGSNVAAGEAVLDAVKTTFFGPFRVSVLFDANGCQHDRRGGRAGGLAGLRRLARRGAGRRPGRDRAGRPARRAAAGPPRRTCRRRLAPPRPRRASWRRPSARPPAREVTPFADRRPRRPGRSAPRQGGRHRRGGRRSHAPARRGLEGPCPTSRS